MLALRRAILRAAHAFGLHSAGAGDGDGARQMKIFSDDAYVQRMREEVLPFQNRIYELHQRNAELCEKNARLTARVRSAERRVQELTLLCGMKGYAVETTPDTPAVPAKPGVLTLTRISKV
jgi:hypothetical protein